MTPPMTPRENLTRPIVGIENRTAQEVFDIMSDRFRAHLTALASGSGDHAELARLAEMADWMAAGDLGAEGSVLLAASVAAEHSADLKSLLAENAALRAERSSWTENYDRATRLHAATCRDLAEAERKLAEAVSVLREIARGEAPPEQHGHYLAHRQAVDAARNLLSKEPA